MERSSSPECLYPTMDLFTSINKPHVVPPELFELDPDYRLPLTNNPDIPPLSLPDSVTLLNNQPTNVIILQSSLGIPSMLMNNAKSKHTHEKKIFLGEIMNDNTANNSLKRARPTADDYETTSSLKRTRGIVDEFEDELSEKGYMDDDTDDDTDENFDPEIEPDTISVSSTGHINEYSEGESSVPEFDSIKPARWMDYRLRGGHS